MQPDFTAVKDIPGILLSSVPERASAGVQGGRSPQAGESSERSLPPLATAVLEEAKRLAERLREAVRTILNVVPPEAKSAAGLARYASVERTVCTKLLAAVSGEVGAQTLVRIPGPKALTALAQALEQTGTAETSRLSAVAAQLDEFFTRFSGTQRGFARLLTLGTVSALEPALSPERSVTSEPVALPQDPDLVRRWNTYRNARELLRRWSRVQVQSVIFGPSPESDKIIELHRLRGFLGHVAKPGAVPLILSHKRTPISDEFSSPASQGDATIMREFCTDPLPPIETRERGGWLIQYIESGSNTSDEGSDIVLLDPVVKAPAATPDSIGWIDEIFALIDYPAETLIFEVFQHQSLARRCISGIDVHLWQISMLAMKNDRWSTRVPQLPPLSLLGRGLQRSTSHFNARQSEMTAALFAQAGVNPDEYVGYRCEIPIPEWRLGYRMFFDYGGPGEDIQ